VRTPAWAQAPGNPANDPANPQPKDVPDMDAWGNFVRQLVKQYKGKIHHWIIWNEPDVWDPNHPGSTWNGSEEDYYRLLKTAYLNIKAVDPQAKVYLSGFTYWWDKEYDREQYLSRLLKIITADPQAAANNYYFDGAIYHLYYKPQQIYDLLNEVRDILERYDMGDKAIWLNETNAPPSSDPAEPPHREPRFKASLAEQAAFMIQVHAMAFAASAERVQVYKLYNSAEHPEDVQPFGLLRSDKSRRPGFYAYKTVTRYLSGFKSARLFQRGDVNTVVFEQPGKTTTQCRAEHLPSGEMIHGYEIHHGTSCGDRLQPLIRRKDGAIIGHCVAGLDHIWGTYLHGVFDADGFRRWFLDRLRVRNGWPPLGETGCRYDLEPALDRLADHVRDSLDMDRIYQVLQL
jgi:hypothetical protein